MSRFRVRFAPSVQVPKGGSLAALRAGAACDTPCRGVALQIMRYEEHDHRPALTQTSRALEKILSEYNKDTQLMKDAIQLVARILKIPARRGGAISYERDNKMHWTGNNWRIYYVRAFSGRGTKKEVELAKKARSAAAKLLRKYGHTVEVVNDRGHITVR